MAQTKYDSDPAEIPNADLLKSSPQKVTTATCKKRRGQNCLTWILKLNSKRKM